jgi:hypothetical protein
LCSNGFPGFHFALPTQAWRDDGPGKRQALDDDLAGLTKRPERIINKADDLLNKTAQFHKSPLENVAIAAKHRSPATSDDRLKHLLLLFATRETPRQAVYKTISILSRLPGLSIPKASTTKPSYFRKAAAIQAERLRLGNLAVCIFRISVIGESDNPFLGGIEPRDEGQAIIETISNQNGGDEKALALVGTGGEVSVCPCPGSPTIPARRFGPISWDLVFGWSDLPPNARIHVLGRRMRVCGAVAELGSTRGTTDIASHRKAMPPNRDSRLCYLLGHYRRGCVQAIAQKEVICASPLKRKIVFSRGWPFAHSTTATPQFRAIPGDLARRASVAIR